MWLCRQHRDAIGVQQEVGAGEKAKWRAEKSLMKSCEYLGHQDGFFSASGCRSS